MSIRKKPEQAVDLLLDRLKKAKEHTLRGATTNENPSLSSKFDVIEKTLKGMKDVFPDIIRWKKTIVDQLCELEKQLDDDIFEDPEMKYEVEKKLDRITTNIQDLWEPIPSVDRRTSRLLTIKVKTRDVPQNDDHQSRVCSEWVDLGIENKILEREAMLSFFRSFYCLGGSQQAKICSLCLSVFPKNSIIEKRTLIYWWIGEGLVMKSSNATAEEVGEQVFRELVEEGFIRPSSENTSLWVNSFVIDPWIHRMLILIAKGDLFAESSNGKSRRAFLHQGNDVPHTTRTSGDQKETEDHMMMVFNVDMQYLGMKTEWLSKLRKVEVLQMGRWQNSVTHHIEVEDQTLFNALGSQKHLKYLSLRGISRIETLPDSIFKLISLQILDLRACHNLEKLPPTISRLKKLTHLDVSHCYLLESMPKGLEQLVDLQVVKGFVIGKADKNSCKINDLARLMNLKKLSIRVGETLQDDQLGSLTTFPALRILTVSWGDVSSTQRTSIIPPTLTKLDLRCVPFESVPDWLYQTNLPLGLTKLYIKGGRLMSLNGQRWEVKYLRFKYLNINEEELGDYQSLDQFDYYQLRPSTTAVDTPAILDQPAAQTEIEELSEERPKRTLKRPVWMKDYTT